MLAELLSTYLAPDRLRSLLADTPLPSHTSGTVLFADISGFTRLTDTLAHDLGPQRGAEELSRQLNLIYTALIDEVQRYYGSTISFSGDAITCWFPEISSEVRVMSYELVEAPTHNSQLITHNSVIRGVACALGMQQLMQQFAAIPTPSGTTVSLAIKVAVAAGPVRRFHVGDPDIQFFDVLAGATLDRLAATEQAAQQGEVLVAAEVAAGLGTALTISEWRSNEAGQQFAVVTAVTHSAPAADLPEPPNPPAAIATLPLEQLRPWLLPAVYTRLLAGQGQFLAELRPTTGFFLSFDGIDYDQDPQAYAKLDAFIRWVQRVVTRYDGALLQLTIGDKGCYCYGAFGAPQAHKDDTERALMAALALRNAPPELDFIHNIRLGVSRGRMRTGAYGGDTRQTYGVLGRDVNMAARLMQAAPAGQVLVSLAAQQEAAGRFSWEALPPLKVKGRPEPLTVFRLLAAQGQRPLDSQDGRYGLPLIGRAAELASIQQRMAEAAAGQGKLVAIIGEAGLGKSRLVAECVRLASDQGMTIYSGECQSYGTNDGYLVWEPIWQAFFGLNHDDPPELQVAALANRLAQIDPTLLPRLPLLGTALNLSIPDNDLTRSFDAKLRKISLESLLLSCLRAVAQTRPLLLILEDAQWLDPLSHDLLELVGRSIVDLPVLVVLAFRPPELEHLHAPRVTTLPHCTTLTLGELDANEAAELIALKQVHLDATAELPGDVVAQIAARTQGNPFYIEELLSYLHSLGAAPRSAQELEQLDLPASLSSLILSRIDQLSESQKTTLKVASAIGRLFRAAWLWGMYPALGQPPDIRADLETLNRLEITLLDRADPELIYLFKHILARDVAYESLPYATRAWLHSQIGQFIEASYPQVLDQFVDLLAFHYDRSLNDDKRREYLRKAGEAAQATFANAAAINYYQRLLPLLASAEQVPVLLRLAQVHELVGSWDAANTLYHQALDQAAQAGDAHGQARCQSALGGLLRRRGDYAAALEWTEQARAGFAALHDQAGLSQALEAVGEIHRLRGEYEQARGYYQQSLVLAASVNPPEQGQALRAAALKDIGTLAVHQGDYPAAQQAYGESLALLRELGDRPGSASVLSNQGVVARRQGDHAAARRLHEEALALRRALGDLWGIAASLGNLGMVAGSLHENERAARLYEECLVIYRSLGERNFTALTLNNLGDVRVDQGDYAAAGALYRESLLLQRELGDRWAIAYLLEAFAGLAAQQANPEQALQLAGAAAALRRQIGAPLAAGEQARLDAALAPARAALAEAATASWAAGEALDLEAAMSSVLE